MAVSWCDRLASVPSVGFALTPHFGLLDAIQNWSAIMDPMVDQFRNPTFTSADNQNGGYSFTTKDGFLYAVDHTRVSVSFVHRLRAVPVSGGPPIMELMTTPLPYTELLPVCAQRMIEAARLLPKISGRKIFQVGTVSSTRVDLEDVPPGIARFITYLKRPWGEDSLTSFNIEITAKVNETDDWRDYCLHRLTSPENPEDMPTLVFDFHRKFKVGQNASEAHMKTLAQKCGEAALSYFEDIAEGNRFDEHIIDSSAN